MRKDLPYSEWKHEVHVWKAFTTLDKKKLGPALFLSLEGSARDAAHEVTLEDLSKEEGIDILLIKLDSLFLKDEHNSAFEAYDTFERYQRPSSMSMSDYINTFERLYQKAKHFKLELPDGVLAYRLLRSANLSDAHAQLAKATLPSLTYSHMQQQLKKIFSDSVVQSTPLASVKIEPTYESTQQEVGEAYYTQRGRARNAQRGRGRWRGRGMRASYSPAQIRSNVSACVDPQEQRFSGARPKRQLNPCDSYGNVTECSICGSRFHWARKCPDRYEVLETTVSEHAKGDDEEVLITLFSRGNPSISTQNDKVCDALLGETLSYGIIDSGCSKSVCGEVWLNCHLDTLSDADIKLVCEEPGQTYFKFGDGAKIRSMKRVKFPAVIAGKKVCISTDVIPSNIPLLLSKEALKKCNALLDFSNDTARIFGTQVSLSVTANGHYIISLTGCETNAKETIQNALFCGKFERSNDAERLQMARKIHKQFGHPRSYKLKSLCKDAGVVDQKFLGMFDAVEGECDICKKYKRAPLRPVVGFSLAKEFNDVVAIDLKQWSYMPAVWFCHMIDMATRYSVCVVVKKKDSKTILNAIMTSWISVFGCPRQFLSDNGREFNNDDFRSMADSLNIKVCTTAAESPWSNGCNERYNGVIGGMVKKILEDTDCTLEVALAWAVSAKNSLENHLGFSPNQLVFGRNPNYPSCLTDKPPALGISSGSDIVRCTLNALHKARQAFLQKESCEKLRRSLLYSIRPSGETVVTGDWVFYRRSNEDKWRGPGSVIGQENKQILVKHGGVYYRCHACHVMKDDGNMFNKSGDGNDGKVQMSKPVDSEDNPGSISIETAHDHRNQTTFSDTDDEESDIVCSDDKTIETLSNQPQPSHHCGKDGNTDTASSMNKSLLPALDQDLSHGIQDKALVFKEKTNLPVAKSRISYILRESDDRKNATVLGRAGKATGRNRFLMNILDDGEAVGKSIDWREVDDWKNIHDAYISSSDEILTAKMKELDNWKKNKVYTAVPDNGEKCVSCRWVLTEKQRVDGSFIKARLVARGFEEDSSSIQTDSPTCGKESLRVVLAIAASQGWSCNSIDVKAAFLQGAPLDRVVYLRPPIEASAGDNIWKMNTCVYGLNDASRYWYLRVREELLSLGMKASKYDAAIFYWHKNGELVGVITCHVDDFFWCGTSSFGKEVIGNLRKTFCFGAEQSEMFRYLGLQVQQQCDSSIVISQHAQVDDLRSPQMSPKRKMQKEEGLTADEITSLRSMCGQLNWLASQSRPDLAFDVCDLSCSIKDSNVSHLLRGMKLVRKAQSERVSIRFPVLDLSQCSLIIYSDASYGNLPDGSSQGGFIIFLCDESGACAPITWSSTKIRRIVRSTLAAECMALQDAADAGILISSLFSELMNCESKPLSIVCKTDSKGLYKALYSTKCVQDKRLRVDIARLRQMIEREELSQVCWVEGSMQLADCLTKRTASSRSLLEVLREGKM